MLASPALSPLFCLSGPATKGLYDRSPYSQHSRYFPHYYSPEAHGWGRGLGKICSWEKNLGSLRLKVGNESSLVTDATLADMVGNKGRAKMQVMTPFFQYGPSPYQNSNIKTDKAYAINKAVHQISRGKRTREPFLKGFHSERSCVTFTRIFLAKATHPVRSSFRGAGEYYLTLCQRKGTGILTRSNNYHSCTTCLSGVEDQMKPDMKVLLKTASPRQQWAVFMNECHTTDSIQDFCHAEVGWSPPTNVSMNVFWYSEVLPGFLDLRPHVIFPVT